MTVEAPHTPDTDTKHEVVEELRSGGTWRGLLFLALAVVLGSRLGLSAIAMIVGLIVMIFLHELGHYVTAKWAGMKVTEFFLGFGPRLWSFRRGETEYGIKAIPAGAYVKIIGMSNLEEVDPADEDRTYRVKPYWRRMSVALAGSTMHFILALALIFTVFAFVGLRDPGTDRWTVHSIVGPSAAEEAGLQVGDRIVAVDGRTFPDFDATSEYLRAHPGEEVTLDVVRGGEELTLTATLGTRNPNTGEEVGFLGVGPTFPVERLGVLDAAEESVRMFGSGVKASILGLGKLVSPSGVSGYVDTVVNGDDAGPGEVDADRPTSVVGVVQIGSQVAEYGWVNVLQLLFGVNLFIGIFNLLPLLPFDGGHAAIATYEKIRSMISRRRYQADVGKMMPVAYAVVVALALLFITSVYLDIADPISLN